MAEGAMVILCNYCAPGGPDDWKYGALEEGGSDPFILAKWYVCDTFYLTGFDSEHLQQWLDRHHHAGWNEEHTQLDNRGWESLQRHFHLGFEQSNHAGD